MESVFSGVKRLLGDFAATMSPELLAMYVFVHFNWQYEWMRPSIDEIVQEYIKIYADQATAEDIACYSDEDAEDAEDDGEADELGGAVEA